MALQLALVGCGSMGAALLKGWLTLPDSYERFETIWVIAPHRDKVEPFLADARVEWLPSPQELPDSPQVIVFAVKPSILADIMPSYARFKSLFISIAAGKPLSFYQEKLGLSVMRAMPNTPVMIHKGVVGLLGSPELSEEQKKRAMDCFQGLGVCFWVESDDAIDKVTALSGSGPAYVFTLMESLAQSAKALGLDEETSEKLALYTFWGAASYVHQSGESPAILCQRVISPQGTTAAALQVLQEGGLNALMEKATYAAYQRARELRDER